MDEDVCCRFSHPFHRFRFRLIKLSTRGNYGWMDDILGYSLFVVYSEIALKGVMKCLMCLK